MRWRFIIALAISVLVSLGIGLLANRAEMRKNEPIYIWSTHHLKSIMAWDACRFGPPSCRPIFHPVPDGMFRGLTCSAGWCGLRSYYYWTEENCNRTTACGLYKPHRGAP